MSTYAAIFAQNENGLYDGVTVKYDGYIDSGVGEQLVNHYIDSADIHSLCSGPKTDIRVLGDTLAETEYYPNETINRKDRWRNLDFNKMISQIGLVDYGYVFMDNEWKVYSRRDNKFISVAYYLDVLSKD